MSDEIKILAVDDDELTLIVLRKMLETGNCVTDTAASAREAVEMLRQNRYDALLVDMIMPGMSGIEFYEDIDKEFPGTRKKVIFMTSDVASEANWDFVDGQGLPYVMKPFVRNLLFEQIAKTAGRSPVVVQPEPSGRERRVRRRIATTAKVKIDFKDSSGSSQIGTMIDASLKGVSFWSDREYAIGTELVVEYPYPNVSSLPQKGAVVKCEKHENGTWRIAVKL